MKISQVKIKNFRGYQDETTIEIGDLTTFVGKNDAGKSTILEALDIFFNEGKGVIKLDEEDFNKSNSDKDIEISVVFENLPQQINIDSTNETTLEKEYLLNQDEKLEIIKKYPKAKKEKVFIKAYHPTNENCEDLLLKKQTDLRKIIDNKAISCENKSINAVMRKAIWQHFSEDLKLEEVEIDVTKEDAKNIWEKLKGDMPLYSLFQSDRKNSDGDSEIQDPMKLAVKEIINDQSLKKSFDEIANTVSEKLKQVADKTLEKLNEMNPEIAKSLEPVIPETESLKWADVFKNVSIASDQDIPINKRGSGVKRLVLLNFFRAEAERKKNEKNIPSVIYAIEEPETSQHLEHQRKLIKAFLKLSRLGNTQVILTTHSSSIVKMMEFSNLKLVNKKDDGTRIVDVKKKTLPFPSLNEVNVLAFGEGDEHYHNELYGFIKANEGWMSEFKEGKDEITYTYINNSKTKELKIILSTYIRHQIHHPENKENRPYSEEKLQESIHAMRTFINEKNKS